MCKKLLKKLPDRALYDSDLVEWARKLGLLHFRGVYMRDSLPARGPRKKEAMIVNLDTSLGDGTHWVCFHKDGELVDYFDSYGDLQPPLEVQQYLAGNFISYNTGGFQSIHTNSEICGHLCLAFLLLMNKDYKS